MKHKLKISIEKQTLELFEQTADELSISLVRHPISSSKFGLGTEPGSNKTPLGNFFIEEKIGDGEPERMIFKSRKATGEIASLGSEEDQILTRILWLDGLDSENTNTHDRYIYIHGTNQENLIGTPASHGCIRLRNADMIALFDAVEVGDQVEIAL
ncbi:MAG: L,D-transpeptidase [Chthoniobacterales bacterium]|nr:L,D-transpeptidase [Chthoniobacterales bacterium]